tara:strand:+ start:376 stop:603 length:228 start_codon:yes stop_codon:yes gene_type:complete
MIDFSQTEIITLPFAIVMELGLYFVVAAYVIFTAILYYHWQTYGVDRKMTSLTLLAYTIMTVPLILVMVTMWLLF